jgi:hypothetical protein
MEKSLFQKNSPEQSKPSPHDLIGPEIRHLKKGTSVRHGPNAKSSAPPWLVVIAFCGLAYLYLLDPVLHAWYRGEAISTYLYLHNYGTESQAGRLVATGIFTPHEVNVLNHRMGSFNDYYASVEAANQQAETIIKYMADVRLLHESKYQTLDPVGRMRYLLFIRTGIYLPTNWDFLDPGISD